MSWLYIASCGFGSVSLVKSAAEFWSVSMSPSSRLRIVSFLSETPFDVFESFKRPRTSIPSNQKITIIPFFKGR